MILIPIQSPGSLQNDIEIQKVRNLKYLGNALSKEYLKNIVNINGNSPNILTDVVGNRYRTLGYGTLQNIYGEYRPYPTTYDDIYSIIKFFIDSMRESGWHVVNDVSREVLNIYSKAPVEIKKKPVSRNIPALNLPLTLPSQLPTPQTEFEQNLGELTRRYMEQPIYTTANVVRRGDTILVEPPTRFHHDVNWDEPVITVPQPIGPIPDNDEPF